MNNHITDIENSIRRMTAAVRQNQAGEIARSFGEDPEAEVRPLGWWVLACGEAPESDSEGHREAARMKLLTRLRVVGLVLPENIWVWNEQNVPQLVISTVPSLKRAETLAARLRSKGLDILIRREKI
jgi:hypothetical protein